MREANDSRRKSLETSLKMFDISSNGLLFGYSSIVKNTAKTTIHLLFDVGLLDNLNKYY